MKINYIQKDNHLYKPLFKKIKDIALLKQHYDLYAFLEWDCQLEQNKDNRYTGIIIPLYKSAEYDDEVLISQARDIGIGIRKDAKITLKPLYRAFRYKNWKQLKEIYDLEMPQPEKQKESDISDDGLWL